MLQFLIEEALLDHLELADALQKAREAEQQRSDEAVGQSQARLERAQKMQELQATVEQLQETAG